MPLVGLVLGHGLWPPARPPASYLASIILVALGGWILIQDKGAEQAAVERLAAGGSLAPIALGRSPALGALTPD